MGSSTGGGQSRGIFVDTSGNIYHAVIFEDTIDCDPDPGLVPLICTGGYADGAIIKLNSNGDFVFAKHIKSSSNGNVMIQQVNGDASGNIYVIGHFVNVVDFDPGPAVYNLSTSGFTDGDVFILKLDQNGNFIWAKQIGDGGSDIAFDLTFDDQSNIYYICNFSGSVDFDPNGGSYYLSSNGSADCAISKLDSSGNFRWAKKFGSNGQDDIRDIELDGFANVYTTGIFNLTADFDTGPGTLNLTSAGGYDAFIHKLDSAGNFIWAKRIGAAGIEQGLGVGVDDTGAVTISGTFQNTVDFDPGAGTYNITSVSLEESFILRLASNGNFVWVKSISSTGYASLYKMTSDSLSNLYLIGLFEGVTDFDPGLGATNTLPLAGTYDGYLAKYNNTGDLIAAHVLAGNYLSYSLYIDNNLNMYVSGQLYDSLDIDLSSNINNIYNNSNATDAFLVKWSQDSCSTMILSIDSVYNVACDTSGLIFSNASGGLTPYSYFWNTTPPTIGAVGESINPGIWQVTANDVNGCLRERSVLLGGPYGTNFDLTTNLVTGSFRPGFNTDIWLDSYNAGCVPVSGQIKLCLDTLVQFNSAVPMPNQIAGDTLIWNFSLLTYPDHLIKSVNVITDTSAIIGNDLYFNLSISPTIGDYNATNNIRNYTFPVVNGYDPNDKKTYPHGLCNDNYILINETITYTIRFQNTGNAEAINIYILDTLDPSLDLNSVRIVGSSHELITEVLPGNVLKFRFDNIMLPDSNSNELLSNGYVIFEVMPDSNISNNTPLENTSHIFFDFNIPVTTNTTHNTLVNVIPNNIDNTITQIGNQLTSNHVGGSYQWIDCSNSNMHIGGETSQTFSPNSNGSYAVIITANGCIDTSTCVTISDIGIDEEASFNGISISPNPTSSTVNISSPNTLENITISLSDINGKVLIQMEEKTLKNHSIDLSHLCNGMYYIYIHSSTELTYFKVIKN